MIVAADDRPELVDRRPIAIGRYSPTAEDGSCRAHLVDRLLLTRLDSQSEVADRTQQVLLAAVRAERHEVQAELLLRVHLVHEHVVVALGTGGRRNLAAIVRARVAPAHDHDHAGNDLPSQRLALQRTKRPVPGVRPDAVVACLQPS